MGVFSSLNNIRDISLNPEYGAFMGYTQEELEANFGPHIEAAAPGRWGWERESFWTPSGSATTAFTSTG
jgi:hypothetical protein